MRSRERPIRHDEGRYKDRWRTEVVLCRRKDFCRLTARFNALARDCASAIALAAVITFWC